jgi:NAD(P)H-hydrate epimerase
VLSAEAVDELRDKLATYTVGLIGPGITTDARSFIDRLFDGRSMKSPSLGGLPPLVVDADALNILAQIDHWWTRVPAPAILTPHPGEMSRLTRLSMKEIEADRLGVAIESAKTWGHVVVLKGAFSVIASPDEHAIIMPFANPALATAGSGDVLAGTIAAMRAQGLAAYPAAICGTYLHGAAGEIARREIGSAGVMAGDLLMRLPQVLTSLK